MANKWLVEVSRCVFFALLFYIVGRLGLPLVWHVFSLISIFLAHFYAPLFLSERSIARLREVVTSNWSSSPTSPCWLSHSQYERAEWFNVLLLSIWPQLRLLIEKETKNVQIDCISLWSLIRNVEIVQLDLGSVPARLHGVQTRFREDEILVDFNIQLDAGRGYSRLAIFTPLVTLPLSLRNLSFDATLRLVLDPKLELGEARLMLLKPPKVSFDLLKRLLKPNATTPKWFMVMVVDMLSMLDTMLTLFTEFVIKLMMRSSMESKSMRITSPMLGLDIVRRCLREQHLFLTLPELPWGVLNLKVINCDNIEKLSVVNKMDGSVSYYAMVRLKCDGTTHVFTSLLSSKALWHLVIELPVHSLCKLGQLTIELWQLSEKRSAQFLVECQLDNTKRLVEEAIRETSSRNIAIEVMDNVVANVQLAFGLLDNDKNVETLMDDVDDQDDNGIHEGVLVIVIHSGHSLPLTKTRSTPDTFVQVSVCDVDQNTAVIKGDQQPVFEHRMTFLVRSFHNDTLIIAAKDAASSEALGWTRLPLRCLDTRRPLLEVELELKGALERHGGVIKCSLRTSFIIRPQTKLNEGDKEIEELKHEVETDQKEEETNEIDTNINETLRVDDDADVQPLDNADQNIADMPSSKSELNDPKEEEDSIAADLSNKMSEETVMNKECKSSNKSSRLGLSDVAVRVGDVESEESSLPEAEQSRRPSKPLRRRSSRRSRSLPSNPKTLAKETSCRDPCLLVSMVYSKKMNGLIVHVHRALHLPRIQPSRNEASIAPNGYVKVHLLESVGLSSVRLAHQKWRSGVFRKDVSPSFDEKLFIPIQESDLMSRRLEMTVGHEGVGMASVLVRQALGRKGATLSLVLGRCVVDLNNLALGLKVANEVSMQATWFNLRPDRNMSKFLVLHNDQDASSTKEGDAGDLGLQKKTASRLSLV